MQVYPGVGGGGTYGLWGHLQQYKRREHVGQYIRPHVLGFALTQGDWIAYATEQWCDSAFAEAPS